MKKIKQKRIQNSTNLKTLNILIDGIIFRKYRIVVPDCLFSRILDELHETHLGIIKVKQLARRYVYWPNIDREIERLVKRGESCALTNPNHLKVPVDPWDLPENIC